MAWLASRPISLIRPGSSTPGRASKRISTSSTSRALLMRVSGMLMTISSLETSRRRITGCFARTFWKLSTYVAETRPSNGATIWQSATAFFRMRTVARDWSTRARPSSTSCRETAPVFAASSTRSKYARARSSSARDRAS